MTAPAITATEPVVTLAAAGSKTIKFLAQNGQTIDGSVPQRLELPHLVLRRNGRLTAADQRTLTVVVRDPGIDLPGALLSLELATVHQNPDAGNRGQSLAVHQMTRWATSAPVTFTVTFEDTTGDGETVLATPTDYYSLALTISRPDGRLARHVTSYALLLESQWLVPLRPAAEETAGAAPDTLVIYYTDMTPFQRVAGDQHTRLARAAVESYVGERLAPELAEAFRLQSNEWGFMWHEAWTGLRGDEDGERLSVALVDGETWFHGVAPHGANSSIAINVNGGLNSFYATLADGIVSVFHHELFHNLQRDLRQTLAGGADIDGPDRAWAFITEGMAVAAQAVARPDLEYAAEATARAFFSWSNSFLHGTGSADQKLNASYETLNPYQGALYWRFLFEAAGGAKDPAAGMVALRNVLETLYSGEVVDIDASDDLVQYLPDIVTHALAKTPASPFRTYRESLRAFARSIYAMRVGGPDGLYDPNHLFATPAVGTLSYPAAPVRFDPQRLPKDHGIGGSFGIDFVEIALEPVVFSTLLVIEVRGATGGGAEFDVQAVGIDAEGAARTQEPAPGSFAAADGNGGRVARLTINPGGEALAGVAVIVVRVDSREREDGEGRYTITVHPAATAL